MKQDTNDNAKGQKRNHFLGYVALFFMAVATSSFMPGVICGAFYALGGILYGIVYRVRYQEFTHTVAIAMAANTKWIRCVSLAFALTTLLAAIALIDGAMPATWLYYFIAASLLTMSFTLATTLVVLF